MPTCVPQRMPGYAMAVGVPCVSPCRGRSACMWCDPCTAGQVEYSELKPAGRPAAAYGTERASHLNTFHSSFSALTSCAGSQ